MSLPLEINIFQSFSPLCNKVFMCVFINCRNKIRFIQNSCVLHTAQFKCSISVIMIILPI